MVRKKVVLSLLVVLGFNFGTPVLAQVDESNIWSVLTDVSFSPKYLEEFGTYLVPEFGPAPKKLENKTVKITGYVIPADPENDLYILSYYPFSACFFCGEAGPDSIVELVFKDKGSGSKRSYEVDDYLSFQGTFKLNKDDPYHTNYILYMAEEVK